jgi:hypothetical protein
MSMSANFLKWEEKELKKKESISLVQEESQVTAHPQQLSTLTNQVECLNREVASLKSAPVHSHENIERRIITSLFMDQNLNKVVCGYMKTMVKRKTAELTNTLNWFQNRIRTLEIQKAVQTSTDPKTAILAADEGCVLKDFDRHKSQVTKEWEKMNQEIATLKQKSLPTLKKVKT